METAKQGVYPLTVSTNKYPSFSERLKIAMLIRDISVEELAASTYLTKSTICGYRAGYRSPNLEILRLLSKSLNVSADFLLGLKEDIYI